MKHRGVAANVKGGRGGSSSITSTAMAEYEHEERGPIKLARRGDPGGPSAPPGRGGEWEMGELLKKRLM